MTDTYLMRGIPTNLVQGMWRYAEPFVKRALDYTAGELSSGDLLELCLKRDVQLWIVTHGPRSVGAVTTEIVEYPRRKHCRVITLAGSGFADWIELCDNTLADWALNQGCDALESFTRKGMVPKLLAIGWRHKHSIVIKELRQ